MWRDTHARVQQQPQEAEARGGRVRHARSAAQHLVRVRQRVQVHVQERGGDGAPEQRLLRRARRRECQRARQAELVDGFHHLPGPRGGVVPVKEAAHGFLRARRPRVVHAPHVLPLVPRARAVCARPRHKP